jgi:hypothetical protein
MGALEDEFKYSNSVKITGQDELYGADVISSDKKRLCVDALISSENTLSYMKNTYRVLTSETVITLSQSVFTTIYSYNGSGLLLAFAAKCSSYNDISFILIIDGVTVFEITNTFIRAMWGTPAQNLLFPSVGESVTNMFDFRPPYPIKYNSSVLLQAKKLSATARTIDKYQIVITKET